MNKQYDVIIIGSGPSGYTAAIYAARKGIRTGIVAERLGGQLLDTVGIENFISVKETEGHKLATGLEQHISTYDVDVMNSQRAAALIAGDLIEVKLAGGAALKAKAVIIATGARWREIDVPGERDAAFGRAGLPALPELTPLVAEAEAARDDQDASALEEVGLRFIGAVIALQRGRRTNRAPANARDEKRVTTAFNFPTAPAMYTASTSEIPGGSRWITENSAATRPQRMMLICRTSVQVTAGMPPAVV